MKHVKSPTALILTLALLCTLLTGAAAPREKITAYLSPDITVIYNGEPQALQDAAGNAVYPLSYNDTTYLPIRAAGNFLGIDADWDQTTQTVHLHDSANTGTTSNLPAESQSPTGKEPVTAYLDPNITVTYNGEPQLLQDAAGNRLYPLSLNNTTYLPIRAVGSILGIGVDWDQTAQAVILSGLKANYGWVTIDWTTASDSYIKVSVNDLPDGPSAYVSCRVKWDDNGTLKYGTIYSLTEGEWTIPLFGGSTDYTVSVYMSFLACEHYLTDAEKAVYDAQSGPLTANFTASVTNSDNVWLLSAPDVDIEHAPLTRAKALEITGNCETDAEKIDAIFRWVAENIQYDYEMADEIMARETRDRSKDPPTCLSDEVNGTHTPPPDIEELGYTDQSRLNLDAILTRESGVCAQYAVLMAGMLRSLGVPCKVVRGSIRAPDGEWWGHGWVAVKPESGTLDIAALGGGQDFPDRFSGQPTGWIRLDPTNGLRKPEYTSNDENYRVSSHH